MRGLIFSILLVASSSVFAASVSLRDEAKHETKFFDITSVAFSSDGIELRVNGTTMCIVDRVFLENNRISGLD